MSALPKFMTLERFINEQEMMHPGATGEFSGLLHDLSLAAKLVWREVSKAGLVNILGTTDRMNVSGDVVKKLDEFADETIYKAMDHGGHVCVMASEENEDILQIPDQYTAGKYVLLYDPLDGSSNIDANITIGSIFSVFKRATTTGKGTLQDCLQPGYKQVAAGYIIYGSSTIFVYSTGHGVHGFTLDPSVGEFLLSHEDIRIPVKGKIYSLNEGNFCNWESGMQRYIQYLKEQDKATDRPYSLRYIGTMVGDSHRTLLYGGIFAYPGDKKNPQGKLRLMYECNPMAFIIEQAGGRSSDGTKSVLQVQPASLHQHTPVFLGSTEDVKMCEEFLQGKR
ncbi:MAG: class 1 fructose-bisphosphatase [Ignavibacteria bacterium]|nr:class 1 fructose-bisphosphatase [Ignavibacteria bacterium]MBI3765823.1 class 1 fructose-bisphosphatase [Ignavibacteriales bacterium]